MHINLFDAYAEMIFFKDYKLGYIPRSENKEISKLLEMGHNDIFEVRINQIVPHADPEHQIGVIVKLEKKSKFFLICAPLIKVFPIFVFHNWRNRYLKNMIEQAKIDRLLRLMKMLTGNIFKLDKDSPHFKDISDLLHFTEEESHILQKAIDSIAETNIYKQNLKKKLGTLYDYKILAETTHKGIIADNINILTEAINSSKQVILKQYQSAKSK